jgi:hypothetical protein
LARQGYGRHSTVVTVADDNSSPVGTNEWNDDINDYGILGFTSLEETIASGIVTLTASAVNQQSSVLRIDGEADANDILNEIAISETAEYDLLYLFAENSGRTITVTHNSGATNGNIFLLAGTGTKNLSLTVPMIIMQRSSNWYEYGGSGTSGAGDLTGNTLASGVINSSLTKLGLSAAGVVKTASNGSITSGTIGIANDNIVEIDDADAADNDFARFTASGLEGRDYGEVRTDLGLVIGTNVQAYSANTALTTNKLSDFAATTSAELKATIADETGSGLLVFATSPALTTPTATQLDILAEGNLRLQDASGGQYIGFKAPTTVTNYTLTMPGTVGAEDTVLKMSATSGTLEWGTAGGGSTATHDFIKQISSYAPSDPTNTTRKIYIRSIDSSNEGVFALIAKNGSSNYEEVQLA